MRNTGWEGEGGGVQSLVGFYTFDVQPAVEKNTLYIFYNVFWYPNGGRPRTRILLE